ncbi:hypothetical protein [Salinicola rhizosphaerae]|uniref:Uncharacterized protein n=1 Tax=Salinicola rhizosphaerae TaxID=1443141 RepID=A0ABQ3DTR5_9GAMM|nr:hypothetical protein [Salinicola rhizosphaerae]GHB12910.1 hypothetical protein GCM10009038_08680 [Salinicola rhizosphaerae]
MKNKILTTTIAIALATASLSANAGFMVRSELHGVKANASYGEPAQNEDEKEFEDFHFYMFYTEYFTAFGQSYYRDIAQDNLTDSEYPAYVDGLIEEATAEIESNEAYYKAVITDYDTGQVIATIGSTLN